MWRRRNSGACGHHAQLYRLQGTRRGRRLYGGRSRWRSLAGSTHSHDELGLQSGDLLLEFETDSFDLPLGGTCNAQM